MFLRDMANKALVNISYALFFSFFPIFLLVFSALEIQIASYYSLITPIVFAIIGLSFFIDSWRINWNYKKKSIQTFILFLLFVLYIFILFILNIDSDFLLKGVSETFNTFVIGIICYWLGKNIKSINVGMVVYLPLIIIFFLICYFLTIFSIFELSIKLFSFDENIETAYQSISRNLYIMILTLVYLNLISNEKIKWIYVLFVMVIIFILGSRTYFLLSIITFLPLFIKPIIIFPTIIILTQIPNLEKFRIFQILDIFNSASFLERSELRNAVIYAINEYPIWGLFFDYRNTYGSYDHGIFSVWQNYGLLGFLIFIFFLFVLPIYLFFSSKIRLNPFIISTYLSVVFLCVFSEPIMLNMFLFFYLGGTIAYFKDKRYLDVRH